MTTDEKYLQKLAKKSCSILKDKEALKDSYIHYMLDRTNLMFEYEGLPDTMPASNLEFMLQTGGFVVVTDTREGVTVDLSEEEKGITPFNCGLGGKPDILFRPTQAIIANPHYNAKKVIGKDCVLFKNDFMMLGLLPMFDKFASQITEADISLKWALVNSRILSILKASNDSVAETCKRYLKAVEDGSEIGVIVAPNFANESVTATNYGSSSAPTIKDIIEGEQYVRASWFNELGLQANFNMKREAINESEAGMNEDSLSPLVDEMLACRKKAVEEINAMFGTNISVRLASSWNDEGLPEENSGDGVEKLREGESNNED